ncbi:MAG: hypothetical protein P2A85_11565 [Microcoleus anatoxicus]|uniref:hypothetical protein n=1 Tax=Microcoleus anatoxicus TaxID=2705319 RepID=UPI003670FC52
MTHNKNQTSDKILQEAKQNPNGWVYKIEGRYAPNEYVPPEAIVGAWKVDANGNIVGDFIPNPTYNHKQDRDKSD